MGTLRERSKGVWEVRAFLGNDPVTGKKRQISRTYRGGKRGAQALLADLERDVRFEKPASTSTLGALLDEWIATTEGSRSPTTIREYRRLIAKRIKPALGDVPLNKLTPRDLDAFYAQQLTEVGKGTVRQMHAIIHRALKVGVRWQWLSTNPADNAEPPVPDRRQSTTPSTDEVKTLFAAAAERDPMQAVVLHVAAVTGLRRGELAGLQWRDLNAQAKTLHVCRAVICIPKVKEIGQRGTMVKDTKTHATAHLPIDDGTLAVLSNWHGEMKARAEACDAELLPTAFIFSHTGDSSRPIYPDWFTQQFRSVRKAVGLPTVRLHDLRHFMATALLDSGASVITVQGRARHTVASTTTDLYGHQVAESDRKAADTIADLLA